MTTKTPAELWDEIGVTEDETAAEERLQSQIDQAEYSKGPHTVIVHCKSCGHAMDVSDDPENWKLQCGGCIGAGVPLPPGYELLIGGDHDGA